MKPHWVTLLACFVLVAGLVGCQKGLSDEDIDKVVDRITQTPTKLDEETVDRMVDAFMAHPKYMEYLEDDAQMDALVDAFMAHPRYLEYLETDDEYVEALANAMMEHPSYQTTAQEDCTQLIVMAAVMSGAYTLPAAGDEERLCAWYESQME